MGKSFAARRGGAAALALVLGALPLAARAADNFTADITVGAQTAHVGFKTAEEVIDIVKTQNLGQQVTYTGVEAATVVVNFRGLDFVLTYPAPGSTQLNFAVP